MLHETLGSGQALRCSMLPNQFKCHCYGLRVEHMHHWNVTHRPIRSATSLLYHQLMHIKCQPGSFMENRLSYSCTSTVSITKTHKQRWGDDTATAPPHRNRQRSSAPRLHLLFLPGKEFQEYVVESRPGESAGIYDPSEACVAWAVTSTRYFTYRSWYDVPCEGHDNCACIAENFSVWYHWVLLSEGILHTIYIQWSVNTVLPFRHSMTRSGARLLGFWL